jgi:ABC-2 type transport system ATP-binding protein
VFFSTHILTDVERVCDSVAVLDRGRVVRRGSIDELKREGGAVRLEIEVDRDVAGLAERLGGQTWCLECVREGDALSCAVADVSEARRAVPVLVAELGVGLVRLVEAEPTLEDVFVELVGGEG